VPADNRDVEIHWGPIVQERCSNAAGLISIITLTVRRAASFGRQ
jgi:hypothetical protein